MVRFLPGRRRRHGARPATDRPGVELAEIDRLEADGRLLDALDRLRAVNRSDPDPEREERIVRLRHRAFDQVDHGGARPSWPPRYGDPFPDVVGPPEVTPAELTPDALGGAMVNHGALLVRGLVTPPQVTRLIEGIDRAFAGRDAWEDHPEGDYAPWFVPFQPLPPYAPKVLSREWVREGGAVWTADSPRVMFELLEAYDAIGLGQVIGGYLGERPAVSLRKCTLRRVPAGLERADWHQDGAFLGDDVRSVNVWLALTQCGGASDAPGLEYVPGRVGRVLETGTEGAYFDWSVGPDLVERVSTELAAPFVRPQFEAGDALLFDDVFLHRTAVADDLTQDRYAVESWFFAPSTYPSDQIPLVF